MSEAKKRGRPKREHESQQPDLPIPKGNPTFVETIDKYLAEAKWSKRELMTSIGFGETQLYRWGRGESVPRKATVNRIAIRLAMRLDEIYGRPPEDPSPATDAIDGLLNELLEAAGFAASIEGKTGDSCWHKIANNQYWTLGYTSVPEWAIRPTRPGGKPTGKAIVYAETIGRLLGLETFWQYLNFDEMPQAIRQRQVDGIVPLMLVLPGRLFDYSFSERCSEEPFTLNAVAHSQSVEAIKNLEDLNPMQVELLFVNGELGDWGAKVLSQYENSQSFSNADEAISYMQGSVERRELTTIPILLIDSITGKYLIDRENDRGQLRLSSLTIKSIQLKTFNAFAFHPDETSLLNAVNQALPLIPCIETTKVYTKNEK
ncbi:transporter substrate-binding domain-containing protein [Chamaesiphon minutus]|uniref:Periplasmic component of amino acid ABC-type transporter/signal transduction system n=1 Tax=Chamaesiphon minutus (strain ATCC 27169 / PCC 6605) TaxID=1173020 RepID=K9UDQ7_CHAP6|nr:transporter substrate-binding domain-containing protein [Chamaesiphon minutus]AFY92566.1 periplasmic component of amino acid ABC-type transporter/signal transduction system [Chamaesiphon minutus PCC 6605]